MRQRITAEVTTLLEHQQQICGAERLTRLMSIQNEMLGISEFDESSRKFKFLCYELESKIQPQMSDNERAELLRSIFFDHWGFKFCEGFPQQDHIVLSKVIAQRMGHPIAINILLTALAAHCGLHMECVQVANQFLSKVRVGGKGHYLDPNNSGKYVECSDFIALLENDSQDCISGMTYVELIKLWMRIHSHFFAGKISNENLLLFYDIYLTLDPNNLSTLIQRARLLFDMLDERQAWYDFKRYFLLADPSKVPADAKKVYSYLKRKFDTSPQPVMSI